MDKLKTFAPRQIKIVTNAVAIAEELVSNHYKMSASEWLRPRYDINTGTDLSPEEIVHGPFAQIVRYEAHRKDATLGSATYDYYKICLQDHAILAALKQSPGIEIFPFCIYIVTHELIHIVRFSKFLQSFEALPAARIAEEKRVHEKTRNLLGALRIPGISEVLEFYNGWDMPYEELHNLG
jgi:hypothetical protein